VLLQRTPVDHYGMSKNIISRRIFESDNCYTLRLFGVFGSNEPKHRLLKRVLSGEAIELEDKYFDYYYIEDILPVVRNYIDKKPKFKLNMTQNLNKKDKDSKITKPLMKLSTTDKFENNRFLIHS
jgi:nucleoside-diphosphate-sugar epimerase